MTATMDPVLIHIPMPLHTARLLLRPPQAGDGDMLFGAVTESLPELRPWLPWAQAEPTRADSEANVRRMHSKFLLRQDLPLFMLDKAGRFIGGTGLHRLDWTVPRFEIGYWRRAGAGGQGLVTEAVVALARLAFDSLHAQRVEVRMDKLNLPSRRVAEAAGFTFEGVLRQDTLTTGGAVRDTCVYSRVRGIEEAA